MKQFYILFIISWVHWLIDRLIGNIFLWFIYHFSHIWCYIANLVSVCPLDMLSKTTDNYLRVSEDRLLSESHLYSK